MLATTVAFASAQDFQIVKVASVAGAAIDELKPKTIFFNDHRVDETSDKGAFIRFDEWTRTKPVQKQVPQPVPELQRRHGPQDHRRLEERGEGRAADVRHRGALHAVAAGGRRSTSRRFATLPFIQSIDPSIKHEAIKPSDVSIAEGREGPPTTRTRTAPGAKAPGVTACIRSTYKLEGKLPIGVALANKLRDSERKISDSIEFESEMRLLSAADVDEDGAARS